MSFAASIRLEAPGTSFRETSFPVGAYKVSTTYPSCVASVSLVGDLYAVVQLHNRSGRTPNTQL
jgi:hypothetical protein